MERVLLGGRYEVRDLLGGGGMGKVFLARDTVLDRDVALKVLKEQYAESEEFVERFEREAKSAASLNYPNIVAVYDRGKTEDGTYFIAMEYVPGGTLKDRILKEGFLDPGESARLGAQVADALGVAHDRGIVHRDVKPQNILLTASGDTKVADFGIARAASTATISNSSLVLGTTKYMSPEQAMGEPAGPASDLYSLGVVLYEMLTGEVPFDADSSVGVAMKHVMEPPRPPKETNPRVPDALNAVVMKLLEKKPEDRYPGAAALVADLQRVDEGLTPVFAPPAQPEIETERLDAPMVAPTGQPGGVPGGARRDFAQRGPRKLLAVLAALIALLSLAGWGLSRGAEGPVVGTLEGAGRNALEEVQQSLNLGQGKVPDVEGLTEEEARERLTEEGFGVAVERRESPEVDEGKVLDQSVAAGEEAERGSRIALAVGDGPRTATTPELVGLAPDEAEKEIEGAGLKVGEREEVPSEEVPEGDVAAQAPAAGERAEKGTEVDLKISSGPPEGGDEAKVAVPNVLGLGPEEAIARLKEAGCEVAGIRTEASSEPAGTIIRTDPSVGSAVASGTPVTLIISGGPETPTGDPSGASDGASEPSPSSASATASPSSPSPEPPSESSPTPSSPEPAAPSSPEPAPSSPEPAPSSPEPAAPSSPEPSPSSPPPSSAPAASSPEPSPEPEPSSPEPSPRASDSSASSSASAQPDERDGGGYSEDGAGSGEEGGEYDGGDD